MSKYKSLKLQRTNESNEDSIFSSIAVLLFLGFWISICYNRDLFFNEALTCSIIIVALLFFRTAAESGDYNHNNK